ncbi:hypothetical protein [Sporisorium scitamineum]|uniref:Meiotically up-regulated Mug190 protein third C2 domain-containing protein n=1 Tax=Sporisorium scitamineum TaxID=49012 RepID=A0A0F7S8X3_9BASI|nr:hypothetical protein [Sporisorium scitamineum]
MCIVWQQDLADDEVVDMKLPIWRPKSGSDFHRLRQNYHDFRNEEEGGEVGRGESGLFACEDASASGDFAQSRVNTAGYLEDGDDSEPGEAAGSDADDDDADSSDSDEQDAVDGGEGVQRSRSLKEKFTDWKAEKHELHRQHKGIKQYKPVRTMSWLGQSAKSAGAGLKDRFDLQDRRSTHVETEL